MVERIPYNVRQEIIRLLPAPIIKHVSAFVFYDFHPGDDRRIDITICTDNGLLKEYYQRDLISSIHLGCSSTPTDLKIFRNSKAELFYLISTDDELVISASNKKLDIVNKLSNVDHISVENLNSHRKCLKVTRKDDAVPFMFDENLNSMGELFCDNLRKDTAPIVTELKRKLAEAQYVVKTNEKKYKEHVRLRHLAVISSQEMLQPNQGDACFKRGDKSIFGVKIKIQKPWVKVCNKKLVIVLTIKNENELSIRNTHILLDAVKVPKLTYTTKIFKQETIDNHTQWHEAKSRTVESNSEAILAAVMDPEDLKVSPVSGFDMKVLVSFQLGNSQISQRPPTENEHVMPVEDICVSMLETLGDQFEALSKIEDGPDRNYTMVAILSTTEKTDLCLRRIDDSQETITDLLTKYLHMEKVSPLDVVYTKSPYHALYGAMISLKSAGSTKVFDVTLHTRSHSQLLALLHTINDAVPERIIITTTNYKISAKIPQMNEYTEELPETSDTDYAKYASSIINSTRCILKYLDKFMVKMNESRDPAVLNQIGSKIDLNACGKSGFEDFKRNLLDEAMGMVETSGPDKKPIFEDMIVD